MSAISVKRGDAKVPLDGELTADGDPLDLTTADVVRFLARARRGGVLAINGEAEVLEPETAGLVRYELTEEDLAHAAGTYFGEWEVTFDDGSVETYPSNGYVELVIYGDLNTPN